jgi:hypothetical protein
MNITQESILGPTPLPRQGRFTFEGRGVPVRLPPAPRLGVGVWVNEFDPNASSKPIGNAQKSAPVSTTVLPHQDLHSENRTVNSLWCCRRLKRNVSEGLPHWSTKAASDPGTRRIMGCSSPQRGLFRLLPACRAQMRPRDPDYAKALPRLPGEYRSAVLRRSTTGAMKSSFTMVHRCRQQAEGSGGMLWKGQSAQCSLWATLEGGPSAQLRSRTVEKYETADGICPFDVWFDSLADIFGRARIDARIARLRLGSFGEWDDVGEGVIELKQRSDIKRAKEHFTTGK